LNFYTIFLILVLIPFTCKDESVLSDPIYNVFVLLGKRDEVSVLACVILYKWVFIYCRCSFGLQTSPENNIMREHEAPPALGAICKTWFLKFNDVSSSYISSHQLRNVLKSCIWTRAIRYKMQYMHSIAYLLYHEVIFNCIRAYVAYLLYYRLSHCCCFFF
jgi:hypothetical protein